MKRMIAQCLLGLAMAMSALGCANPSAVIKDEIVEFRTKYPDHIQSLEEKGKNIRYAWSGDPKKRPILFVHGSPGSWEGWVHFLRDANLQEHFQMIAVDRPGYGGTQPGIALLSLQKQAEFVAAALKVNQSGLPAILVGHSYGGPVIAQIAMSYPEKVAGLVFVASAVSPDLEQTKWYQYPATWWPIRILIPDNLRVCNEEIMPLKQELVRLLPDWPKISAKAVLIQGEDDPLVPPGNLDFLISHLRADQIVKIDRIAGLNHFIPWQRPDLIVDGIQTLEKELAK
jgi:pimeloyl-ACP methyl ester carboxylesterase